MNEKANRVLNIIILSVCVAVCAFCGINWATTYFQLRATRNTLEQCRLEFDEYRTEFARASDQQSAIEGGIVRCTEITNRTDQLLSSSINTVEDLRTTLSQIRKNEEDLANELYNLRRIVYGNTNNNNNTN